MEEEISAEKLEEILLNFRCSYDKDIENFLRYEAMEYERRKWCSTYLLVDTEKMLKGEIFIQGFFSLSFKALPLSENISKNTRKKLFGGLTKDDTHVPLILIGQMGKNIDKDSGKGEEKSSITAENLLDGAFGMIAQVNKRIPVRCVIVECKALEKLCNIYEKCGFKKLQENELMQYFKIV